MGDISELNMQTMWQTPRTTTKETHPSFLLYQMEIGVIDL